MKSLIVYAHPEPKSFNGALKDKAVETLEAQGYEVKVSDLYAMDFDPVARKEDFKNLKILNSSNTQSNKNAYDNDELTSVIKEEFENCYGQT